MNTRLLMERMFPPPRFLSKPVKIEKEKLKELLYLPDIFSPTMKSGSLEDFTAQLKRKYNETSIKKILKTTNLKLINSGKDSSVYEIKGIDDYVVKINKSNKLRIKYGFTSGFKKSENNYYGHNFGQPVAENSQGVQVLLKVPGEAHSVKNWVEYYSAKKEITAKDGKSILEKLDKLAKFPQEGFDDLAKRIKFAFTKLSKHVDTFNPNNFLIDWENRRISFVDLGKLNPDEPFGISCRSLLTVPLTDNILEYDYFKVFTDIQKTNYMNLYETVESKCNAAYKKHNLSEIEEFIEKCRGNFL